jgi:hypothetical protein
VLYAYAALRHCSLGTPYIVAWEMFRILPT